MVDQLLGYTMALRMDEQMLEQLSVLWSMFMESCSSINNNWSSNIEWVVYIVSFIWISKLDNFEEKKGLQLFYLKQIISTTVSC